VPKSPVRNGAKRRDDIVIWWDYLQASEIQALPGTPRDGRSLSDRCLLCRVLRPGINKGARTQRPHVSGRSTSTRPPDRTVASG